MHNNESKINVSEIFKLDEAYASLFFLSSKKSKQQTVSVSSEERKEVGKVVILSIRGPLIYSKSIWEDFGYVSYERISETLKILNNNPSVKTIIMRIESPGGTAFGASVLAEEIFNIAQNKRVIALADPYAFSAAYEIASGATVFSSVPNGMVGSVGAFAMHFDYSQFLEKEGIGVSIIKSGEKKADGNSYEPLSESAKKDIQEDVDRFHADFVATLSKNRNVSESVILETFGKGARVWDTDAMQNNMIDEIITFDKLLEREFSLLEQLNSEREIELKQKIYLEQNKLLMELEEWT